MKVSHGNLCQEIIGCVLKNLSLINIHELIECFPAFGGPAEGVACAILFEHCMFVHSKSVDIRTYGCA